ncbi:hypothetical protein EPN96_00400 [bacterium]|nr:MAG: hypothetical protein EPN96_00400 [bacterium]
MKIHRRLRRGKGKEGKEDMAKASRGKTAFKAILLIALAVFASVGFAEEKAAAPSWSPGFPMLMDAQVMLMWIRVTGAASYNVYKSEKKDELGNLLIKTIENNYLDTDIQGDRSYFYTVKAVSNSVEVETSAVGEILKLRPVQAPELAYWMGNNMVKLRFDNAHNGSALPIFYKVYKSNSEDGIYQLVGTSQGDKYTDIYIEKTIVYYKATAVDKNNVESAMSKSLKVEEARWIR